MSPNDYFSPLEGQSLLIPGQAERFRGQCPQPVGLYVAALGLVFPAYINAYLYWDNGIPGYTKIGAGNPIKAGDIIVWRSDFPPSNGSGHMDVAAQDGTLASFVAWDSNWYPPLKLAKLTHIGNNNNYIAGYLRRQGGPMRPSKAEVISIYTGFFDDEDFQVPQDIIDAYTGPNGTLDGLLTQLHADASYQAHKLAVNNPPTPGFKKVEVYVPV